MVVILFENPIVSRSSWERASFDCWRKVIDECLRIQCLYPGRMGVMLLVSCAKEASGD